MPGKIKLQHFSGSFVLLQKTYKLQLFVHNLLKIGFTQNLVRLINQSQNEDTAASSRHDLKSSKMARRFRSLFGEPIRTPETRSFDPPVFVSRSNEIALCTLVIRKFDSDPRLLGELFLRFLKHSKQFVGGKQRTDRLAFESEPKLGNIR